MARSTMAALIQDLRVITDTNAGDYTVGVTSYWTDDQLQNVLDMNRREIRYQDMEAMPANSGGTITYTEYRTGLSSWETLPTIQNGNYVTAGTASYSFDANRGVVTFTADTAGAAYVISGNVYDLNAAAVEIWTRKSAHYALAFDVSTDNHTLHRSQIIKHCENMARRFAVMPPSWQRGAGSAGPGSVFAERGDMQ